jgi:hypothetical protein
MELRHCDLSEAALESVLVALGGDASAEEEVENDEYAPAAGTSSMVSEAMASGHSLAAARALERSRPAVTTCTVVSLDTRGNPVSRAAEARLAKHMERIFQVKLLSRLLGQSFGVCHKLQYPVPPFPLSLRGA